MYKQIFLTILLWYVGGMAVFAQKTKKPELLVYGHDVLAFAAAVQGAQSNVSTLWVVDTTEMLPALFSTPLSIQHLPAVDGGVWMDLLMEVGLSKQPSDSLATAVKADMNPRLVQNAVERILARYTNLRVIRGQRVEEINRRRNGWEVVLSDRHRYRVKAVVDGSEGQVFAAFMSDEHTWTKPMRILPISQLKKEQYRTLIASGEADDDIYGISLQHLLRSEHDGIFTLLGVQQLLSDEDRGLSMKAGVGQALGAVASYLAFFKTTSDKVDVRKLQNELLLFRARLLPYQDVAIEDTNFSAVQRTGLAGIFKGDIVEDGFYLGKSKVVTFEEIEPIFKRLYSRSQLWFIDNKEDTLTWESFLSLIRFVGMRGEAMEQEVEKNWSSKLHFEGNFERNAPVTRYQFAVIVDRYASAFVKAINQEGQFVQ